MFQTGRFVDHSVQVALCLSLLDIPISIRSVWRLLTKYPRGNVKASGIEVVWRGIAIGFPILREVRPTHSWNCFIFFENNI